MTANIITLGCSKNLVDSERLLNQLRSGGYEVFHDRYGLHTDLVIINTCGFILDAKQESIDTILSFIEDKKSGNIGRIIVMGCLSERYREELKIEMPEVDAFFGVWEMEKILAAAGCMQDKSLNNQRQITTPSHYAFLKISEGCNRSCAFCAIPGIRGPQRSVPMEDLLEETRNLTGQGVKELILIAQDLTTYGTDLYGKRSLADLLRELIRINELHWIRLHYAYPNGFPEEVIELMASEEKICNYIDIPIQHASDRILKAMGRGHGKSSMVTLLESFRNKIPDVAIRTTVLTGFPGETEKEYKELLDFIGQFRFDRLGIFPYSHEEGTKAGEEMEDDIPEKVKTQRVESIMEVQQQISLELNREKVGKIFRVLIDREENGYYIGRTQYDSPDVDNEVLVSSDKPLPAGTFCRVRITEAVEFDLYGIILP